jgi:arabinogalactan oligomer/maltooligosaccharide transport system permease protein
MMPWMDYILPNLLFTGESTRTIAVGLYTMISGNENANFTTFAAGAVFIAIPITILYLLFQKYLVEGIAAGANKG